MNHNFKVGDKVNIPTTKTPKTNSWSAGRPEHTGLVKLSTHQGFMYVTGFDGDDIVLSNKLTGGGGGDFYSPKDLTLYEENKRIIGYVHKEGLSEMEKNALIKINSYTIKKSYPNPSINFTSDCKLYHELKALGLLDKYFNPVYEEVKPTTKTLVVGDTKQKIVISKNGCIDVIGGNNLDVDSFINMKKHLCDKTTIGEYNVSIPQIKIGCTTITMDELDLIIETAMELSNTPLPEKWYIRGCDELAEYFNKHAGYISGKFKNYAYVLEGKQWDYYSSINILEKKGYVEIKLKQYLKTIGLQ